MQLFVVLIFFGAISLPRSAGDAGAPGAGKDTTAPIGGGSKAASGKARHEACNEIAEKLARFVTDADSTKWAFPDSCYGDAPKQKELKVPEAMSGVRFAIATAPDPISTHLPLLFDRIVETIQKAAQDDGYSYDDSWFPWETTTKEYFFSRRSGGIGRTAQDLPRPARRNGIPSRAKRRWRSFSLQRGTHRLRGRREADRRHQ
jgi:hypothetical protein